MTAVKSLVARVAKTRSGFTDIRNVAQEVFADNPPGETLRIARELFTTDVPPARMLAAFLFAMCAAKSKPALAFLRDRVSRDADWRVQEILAQALDQYCRDVGYGNCLPLLKDWLSDGNSNVRRAASEGPRIWTTRDYFREHPQAAIKLLSALRADESGYVRKSVGNALRDISRKHKELIRAELGGWDTSNVRVRQTHKLAAGFLGRS